MKLSKQFALIDFTNHVIFGAYYFFAFLTVYYHFSGVKKLSFSGLTFEMIITSIGLFYALGLIAPSMLTVVLRTEQVSNKIPFSDKVIKFILRLKSEKDIRVSIFGEEHKFTALIKENINKQFGLLFDELCHSERIDVFYTIYRYVENKAESNALSYVYRMYIYANFYSRLIFAFFISMILVFILMILSFFGVEGEFGLTLLFMFLIAFFIFSRILSLVVVFFFEQWWKNVWRLYIVIEQERLDR